MLVSQNLLPLRTAPLVSSYNYNSFLLRRVSLFPFIIRSSRVKLPPSATCTTRLSTHNTRSPASPGIPASVAAMSTVAIPQQHDFPHQSSPHQHPTTTPDTDDTFDSETPRSSRESSSDRTVDQKKPSGFQRMSAFFPLAYKESAYQWVRHCCSLRFACESPINTEN